MWLSTDQALELRKGGVRPIVVYRIAATPVVRAWSGVGDLSIPTDSVEDSLLNVYLGVGVIRELPEIEVLLNMTAGRLAIAISGISAEIQDLVEKDAADVEGAAINIGIGFLNGRQQLIGSIFWMVDGVLEQVFTEATAEQRTAGIQIAYGAVDRRSPLRGYWSPQDQEARHPGDLGCSRTPLYDEGRSLVWPRW